MHEQQLPAALAADLDGSFVRLVEIYQDRLYAFALRLTGNPQDAEEMVVDALSRAYEALDRYEPERLQVLALRPWLYQITLNVFRNRVRGRRLPVVSLAQPGVQTLVDTVDTERGRTETLFERAALRDLLAVQVAALPERERVVVVLHYIQELGYGEIATLLKQPVGTVKANVHRGIKRLRTALQAYEEWR